MSEFPPNKGRGEGKWGEVMKQKLVQISSQVLDMHSALFLFLTSGVSMQKSREHNSTHFWFDTFLVLTDTKSFLHQELFRFPLYAQFCSVHNWDNANFTQYYCFFLCCCMWFPNSFVSSLCSCDSVDFKGFPIPSTLAASLRGEIWLYFKNTSVVKSLILSRISL